MEANLGGGSSPPTVRDPGQVAATQQGYNTQAAQASQRGSMVNQNNWLGNLGYQQIGTDPNTGVPIYGSNLNLSPQQQQLYNTLTGTQQAAGQGGQSLIQGANYGSQSPTQAIGNESSGIQGMLMNQWLQSQSPWMSQATSELDTKLKNQGLNPSPTANPNDISTWGPYEKAMGQLRQSQQMAVSGAASKFQPQAFSEASSLYGMPASLGMQLAGFGQYTSPGTALTQSPGANYQPADYTGAVNTMEQMQEQNYQAQVAQQNALMSGLFNLAGSLGGAMLKSSDRRLKRDIVKIGKLRNGLPVYSFKFLWSDEPLIGLMADDVVKVKPWAVLTDKDGYLMVDYNLAVT